MKKLLLPLILFCAFSFSFAQIPNAGFELWDNQPVPLLWQTNSRPLTTPAWEPYIVRQDTERYSGNYAADFYTNGVFKAYATTTFPVTVHPQSLSLYYKLSFPPCVNNNGYPQKDTVSVLVEILNGAAVVDSGYWERTSTSFNYSQLTIPISQNATVFDSCRITIWGGKVFGGCGIIAARTDFKVDALKMNYQSTCANTGVVVQGVFGCLLIDTGFAHTFLPINVSLTALGFGVGDTIHFSFIDDPVANVCQQGPTIDITCVDTSDRINCNVSVSLQKINPTSYLANNGSIHAVVTGATPSLFFVWSNGVNGTGMDSITNLTQGNYCVTITDSNNCTATACDSLAGVHTCFDSSQICTSCLCPAIYDPVCGCNGLTYGNSCIAQNAGVTSWTSGACAVDIGGSCHAGFYFFKHIDTVQFNDISTAAVISGYQWSFGDGDFSTLQNPSHVFVRDSIYTVCLTITGVDSSGNSCSDQFCDTVLITHNCIDSTLLCLFPLCCDLAPPIPVCGCDSVTYPNACVARNHYGVTNYYIGNCVTTDVKNISSTENQIWILPNPAKDIAAVIYETNRSGNTEIRISNLLGQELKFFNNGFETSGKHKAEINISSLPNGIYFIEVKSESERKLKKFTVE